MACSLPAAFSVPSVRGTNDEMEALPVFVINLDRAPERLATMTSRLDGLGVSFTRVRAVDGAALSDAEVRASTTAACRGLWCSRSMIGCALSHIRTWGLIAAGMPTEWCLVLEDDARVTAATLRGLDRLWLELASLARRRPAMIVNLSTCSMFGGVHCGRLGAGLDRRPRRGPGLVRPVAFAPSTAAYLITRGGAAELAAWVPRATYHIDAHVLWQRRVPVLAVEPPLVLAEVDSRSSSNMPATHSMPLLAAALRAAGWHELDFNANTVVFAVGGRRAVVSYDLLFALAVVVAAAAALVPAWRCWPLVAVLAVLIAAELLAARRSAARVFAGRPPPT
jgi:hypothetical protein